MTITIYHNPRCSKSRQTLALIQEHGIEPEVVEYLKTPLDVKQIEQLLAMLNLSASDFVRSKESEFKELGLKGADEKVLIKAMSEHPKLIERPVVVKGKRAVIGRPPENVLELL